MGVTVVAQVPKSVEKQEIVTKFVIQEKVRK